MRLLSVDFKCIYAYTKNLIWSFNMDFHRYIQRGVLVHGYLLIVISQTNVWFSGNETEKLIIGNYFLSRKLLWKPRYLNF